MESGRKTTTMLGVFYVLIVVCDVYNLHFHDLWFIYDDLWLRFTILHFYT